MIICHLGDEVAKQICDFYKTKERSQGLPTRYLGAETEKTHTEDGCEIWTTSWRSYITNAMETVEGFLLDYGKWEAIKSNYRNPFLSN